MIIILAGFDEGLILTQASGDVPCASDWAFEADELGDGVMTVTREGAFVAAGNCTTMFVVDGFEGTKGPGDELGTLLGSTETMTSPISLPCFSLSPRPLAYAKIALTSPLKVRTSGS
jgi:hypothetical protein